MKRIAVKDLRAGSIEATPLNIDWEVAFKDYWDNESEDSTQYWEAVTCEGCGATVVLHMGGGDDRHSDVDSESECNGYVPTSQGPMMNYWYPADLDGPEDSAELIADLPLCVVRVNGNYGLALTGGGMDLSWEICEAYTRLGELPPVHFCNLPDMADKLQPVDSIYGRESLARDRYIVAACRQSLRVQMNWAKSKLRRLRDLEHPRKIGVK